MIPNWYVDPCPTILIAGDSGTGKSYLTVKALGASAFYICPENNAVIGAATQLGLTLDYVEILDRDAPVTACWNAFLKQGLPRFQQGKYRAIVIDSLSTLAELELTYWDRILPPKERGGGRAFSEEYGKTLGSIMDLVRGFQRLRDPKGRKTIVVVICHSAGPSDLGKDPVKRKHRADLPGKLAKMVPAQFDISLWLRILPCSGVPTQVFRCNWLDQSMLTRDRFGVVVDGERADLRSVIERVYLQALHRPFERPLSALGGGDDLILEPSGSIVNGKPSQAQPETEPPALGGNAPSVLE
jgi:hypothetical protein